MASILDSVLLTFPARPVTEGEREILRAWVAGAEGLFAYVSDRRGDDPAIYRRIVISRRGARQHSYLIHVPQGSEVWMVISASEGAEIERFTTLRAALSYVQTTLISTTVPA